MGQVLPPSSARAKNWNREPLVPLKYQHADGSITAPDAFGDQVLPPSPQRAALYAKAAPESLKYLLPDGSVVENDGQSGGSPVAEVKWYEGKRLLVMGDSIAYGLAPYLEGGINAGDLINVAYGGATLSDNSETQHTGVLAAGPNNTLSNQLQKVKNDKINGTNSSIPDIVVILCGTNDKHVLGTLNIESEFMTGNVLRPLDELNLVDNIPASLRWVAEQILSDDMYPSAKIFLCSPIQRAGYDGAVLQSRGDCIRLVANRLSVGFVDLYNNSGIYSGFENPSAAGRYLVDGLHPGPEGYSLMVNTILAAFDNVNSTDTGTSFTEVSQDTRVKDFGNGQAIFVESGKLVGRWISTNIPYSEESQLTGIDWINGAPIHQLTVNLGNLPDTSSITVPHGISLLQTVIGYELTLSGNTGGERVRLSFDDTNITVVTTADMSDYNAWVTFRYVVAGGYQLDNLINNSGFSSGAAGWTYYGAKSSGEFTYLPDEQRCNFVFTSTPTTGAYLSIRKNTASNVPKGHICYSRVYSKMDVQNDGNDYTGMRQRILTLYASSGASIQGVTHTVQANDTEDVMISVWGATFDETTIWGFFFQDGSPAKTGNVYSFRAPILIDLTASFGVGNEPTKDWCDANIPFFVGTLTV